MSNLKETFSPFANAIFQHKYSLNGQETWADTAHRVAVNVMGALGYKESSTEVSDVEYLIRHRKFLPGGRYLYASGRSYHQVNNCLLMRAEDSREGWAELSYKTTMALMSGAGIGVDYSDIRAEGVPISRTGGYATGPCSLMEVVNEGGRQFMQGGSRRSAIWAGLNWSHPDIFTFIRFKDWSAEMRALKEKDFTFRMPMELTNISVQLDDQFFFAYHHPRHPLHQHAHDVYWKTLEKMVVTGEPGFSIDCGANAGETLRNACTEVTSADDSDVCNLGSVNLARIESKKEFEEVVDLATLFLVAGTVYSHVPYQKVDDVRQKNRRLGLGLMGVHEWLIQRGKPYAPDIELASWLEAYNQSTRFASAHADLHGLSRPVKTRAIAPNGTIGIIGETTTSAEPVFCKAFKRRYLDGKNWKFQYVIDPTVQRAEQEYGIDPDSVEDAYALSYNVEKRVAMQEFVQRYVDHGISSTINLPHPMKDPDEQKKFGDMLINYLPNLRGITCYPNGARGGQPLEVTGYKFAKEQEGVVFEEDEERCVGGACGV